MKNSVLIKKKELEQTCFSVFLITFCGCYNEISIVVRLQAVNSRDSIPTEKTNLTLSHPVQNGALVRPASIPIETGKRQPGSVCPNIR